MAKKSGARRYSRSASKDVERAMHKRKRGTLKSGKSGKGGTVKSRKQAIAIGLSEARKKGKKVPRKRKSRSPLEAHASWLLDLVARESDLTLDELVQRLLRDRGVVTTDSSLDRFFKRHRVTFKKNFARRRAGAA